MKTWLAAMVLAACALTGCQSPPATSSSGNPVSPTLMTNPADIPAAPDASVSTSQILMIDSSSMPVKAGRATLFIGALHRIDGVYLGNYELKVIPWFLKDENGRLVIVVTDESLASLKQGNLAPITGITGTATTSGKSGRSRPIGATATPADSQHGNLKLWFMAEGQKMVFEPAYHFAGKNPAAVPPQAAVIQP